MIALTLREFVDEKYWPTFRDGLCPKWQKRTDEMLTLLLGELGHYPLTDLAPEVLERWWIQLRKRFKTPVTPNKILTRFKHIMETAVRWKYTPINPVSYLTKVREPQRKFKQLTDEQIQILVNRANPRLRLYILFALYTGARRSSLYKLEEGDIDLDQRTITFRQTKNGEDITVPMHPQLITLCTHLLTGLKTRRLLPHYESPEAISQLFHRLCLRCGIVGFRFHDFRHMVGSRMGAAGAHPKAIMAMLGHKDIKMSSLYTHIEMEVVRQITDTTLTRNVTVPA